MMIGSMTSRYGGPVMGSGTIVDGMGQVQTWGMKLLESEVALGCFIRRSGLFR